MSLTQNSICNLLYLAVHQTFLNIFLSVMNSIKQLKLLITILPFLPFILIIVSCYPHSPMLQQPNQSSKNHKPKLKYRYSQLCRCSEQSANTHEQMYTIEPFEIEPNSLSHQQVTQMIDNWGPFAKIQEKFFVWEFSFQYDKILNIVPQNFYTTAIHYLFMKKLSILIKDFDQNQVLKKSLQLKQIYKVQSLSGKLKGKRFDYLLLVTVKLISFFLGSHTHEVIINSQLEAEIYAILVYVLLGTQVGQRAYSAIIERYKNKPMVTFNGRSNTYKHSIAPHNMSKHSSQHRQVRRNSNRSKKRIGRAQCKTGTALFHPLNREVQGDNQISEMRKVVKSVLAVKEFVPKPKQQQTLDEVLAKAKNVATQMQELKQAKTIEKKEMKHKIINYTQMSCSMDLERSNQSLNVIRNHSLKIKPEKRSKYYQMTKQQDIKLSSSHEQNQVKLPKIEKSKSQVYNYHTILQKKMSGSYWKNIIGQMKENKFQNIEHFPPISANMYLQLEETEQDQKLERFSETVDVIESVENKENKVQLGNVEFLTERIIQTPRNLLDMNQQISITNKISKKPTQCKTKKFQSIQSAFEDLTNQISIIQYSMSTNIKEIYKNKKAFMNVYSSQPLDDLNKKLKKKSLAEWKQIEMKFKKECGNRWKNIQNTYFQ